MQHIQQTSLYIHRIMAKARVSTNPIYQGAAGGYSFYSRNGEQIIRQRRNNSNYGESASRSSAQQRRRVMWANLVNFYKICAPWMPKAFENKKRSQTDYNRFMQVNLGMARIALTKAQASRGVSLVDEFIVSQGSLPAIGYLTGVQAGIATTIACPNTWGEDLPTIGDVSRGIIANNTEWAEGDNLAFIRFRTAVDDGGFPHTSMMYYELTLDSTSTKEVGDIAEVGGLGFIDGYIGISENIKNASDGVVFIHTRKVGGALKVSSQSIVQTSSTYDYYREDAQIRAAIDSYGLDVSVVLDPGE